MNTAPPNAYIQRVNLVLDHIQANPTGELSLEQLAAVAGFSEFHFHRIFKALVGETLSQFVWRVRLERGASLMRANPHLPIAEIAQAAGFGSTAAFSRAFKGRYGCAPSRWDRQHLQADHARLSQAQRHQITSLQPAQQQFEVHFRKLPAQQLAYIRVANSYADFERIQAAYERLLTWFERQGGRRDQTTLYGMSQDDPDITPREQCRFDWCLRVPDDWQAEGEISIRPFPSSLLAVIPLDGDIAQEEQIFHYFWRRWLPSSPFQPRNLPAMEIYRSWPHESGDWRLFHLDCAVPITRL